jgi:hypothetical protein
MHKQRLHKKTNKNRTSLIGKLVFILCIVILFYGLCNSILGDIILKRNGICTEAYLYKQTYGGKTKPSLGYRFLFNSKVYEGLIDEDRVLKVGDTICIVCLRSFPSINRPLTYFSTGEIKCACNK